MVLMRGHNICFCLGVRKIFFQLSSILPHICSSVNIENIAFCHTCFQQGAIQFNFLSVCQSDTYIPFHSCVKIVNPTVRFFQSVRSSIWFLLGMMSRTVAFIFTLDLHVKLCCVAEILNQMSFSAFNLLPLYFIISSHQIWHKITSQNSLQVGCTCSIFHALQWT